jgi:hypothetical protein
MPASLTEPPADAAVMSALMTASLSEAIQDGLAAEPVVAGTTAVEPVAEEAALAPETPTLDVMETSVGARSIPVPDRIVEASSAGGAGTRFWSGYGKVA